ncbi:patatin-like phospholipase family protein [Candidatus Shapirobacteria bacterium]|nr:patatin-like phospholipase family protein [Candidatus Shapirobacteria bacterium]
MSIYQLPKKPKLALALGVGGIRGAAHIGVIKCLLDNNIKIDHIVGCSTGALVGSLYCINGDINDVENFYRQTKFQVAGKKYIFFLEYRRKLNDFRQKLGDITFANLKIPFTAVATNIDLGEPCVLNEGNLFKAVSASVAVPLIMPSVKHHHHTLLDGGITSPVPVSVAREHGDIVLAVNLLSHVFPMNNLENLGKLNDLIKAFYCSVYQLTKLNLEDADFIVEPENLITQVKSEKSIEEMINFGYQATLPIIHRLQDSLTNPR